MTLLKPSELAREIALVLAAQLAVFVLPALLRTLMQLLEAPSMGREPAWFCCVRSSDCVCTVAAALPTR